MSNYQSIPLRKEIVNLDRTEYIECDGYILSFRTYKSSTNFDAACFYAKDAKTGLVDFWVSESDLTLRAFTLINFQKSHTLKANTNLPKKNGLITFPRQLIKIRTLQVSHLVAAELDITTSISLAFSHNIAEIDFGDIDKAQTIARWNNLDQYIFNNNLVGLRFNKLSRSTVEGLAMMHGDAEFYSAWDWNTKSIVKTPRPKPI